MSGFTAGAFAGVLVQLYSNSVRKLPLMRRKFFFFSWTIFFCPVLARWFGFVGQPPKPPEMKAAERYNNKRPFLYVSCVLLRPERATHPTRLHFCLAIVLHCKTHFRFIFCIFFFHFDTIKTLGNTWRLVLWVEH